jgi:hypothetical protein
VHTGGLPGDGLDDTRSASGRRTGVLLALAVGETITLALLLLNLATLDDRGLAAAVGPVHGGLYLAGVLLTWTGRFPPWTKVVAVVPVIGAWLAVRQGRHLLDAHPVQR